MKHEQDCVKNGGDIGDNSKHGEISLADLVKITGYTKDQRV